MQIFAKKWVWYPFNPIALASTTIAKESLFYNAIAKAQCEWNIKGCSHGEIFITTNGLNGIQRKCSHSMTATTTLNSLQLISSEK